MAADLLEALARCNIAASMAIVALWTLRAPLRRCFGAGRAYAVCRLVAPLAAAEVDVGRVDAYAAGPVETTNDRLIAWLSTGDHASALILVWLSGGRAAIAVAAWRHWRFSKAVRAGRAGPAAVGVIQPRLVTPADFAERFTPEERRLVRAHELAHIDRLDARYNAAAALATWLCWFNPLLHLAVRAMRLDQELACDATVLARLPAARRLYAETLLRTHRPAATPLLGCQWRARNHPLDDRIGMLVRSPPSQARRDLGLAILVAASVATFGAAWAMQPPAPAAARPVVILIDLAPPDSGGAQLDAAVYRIIEGSCRGGR